MKLRSSLSAVLPEMETEKMPKSGFQAGYALGFQIGKEDSRRPFDGTSIIIPAHLPGEDVIGTIQKIEALTPHPYELIVANAGSSEITMQYLQKRTGAVRHIAARNGEGIAGVLNKAVFAAHGQILAVLIGVSPNTDNWMIDLMLELERESSVKTIYVRSGNEDVLSRMNVCCFLFRRELLSDIGWWDEGLATLKESVSEWLGRIPNQNRIMVEASGRFI
ncbi:MAG: glycosyltransferase family 2 protein [Bacillota bacterium]